jgi:hypothetical protein
MGNILNEAIWIYKIRPTSQPLSLTVKEGRKEGRISRKEGRKDIKEGRKVGYQISRKERRKYRSQRYTRSLRLTVITLAAGVIYIVVFEYEKASHLHYDVFFRWTLVVILAWHLSLVSKQTRRFWNTKSKSFFNLTLFEGGPFWGQTKNYYHNIIIITT